VRLPELTIEILEDAAWEPALTFPFPPNPHIGLLLKARDKIIEIIQSITDDLEQIDPEEAAHGIHCASARLIEIAVLAPAAVSAELEASLDIAARFRFTQREKSLKGFRRLKDIRIEG
jgi:hypothetical protein